jgi:hypothetical protein
LEFSGALAGGSEGWGRFDNPPGTELLTKLGSMIGLSAQHTVARILAMTSKPDFRIRRTEANRASYEQLFY